jgi:hypothetical protein
MITTSITIQRTSNTNIRNSSHFTRSRWETTFASVLTGTLGLFALFIILDSVFYGNNQSSIVGKVLGIVILSLLCIWLFFFSIFFYLPNVKLYSNYFKRSGFPRFTRRFIMFNEINTFVEIKNNSGKTSLAFILKDGFHFFIPTDQLDPDFKKIFIDRLNGYNIQMHETIQVKDFPDFIDGGKKDIQNIEMRLKIGNNNKPKIEKD